jgi:hypothetical protein
MELEELKKALIKMCAFEYATQRLDFESEFEDFPLAILRLLNLTIEDIKPEISEMVIQLANDAGLEDDYLFDVLLDN